MILINEETIDVSNKETKGVFALIPRTLSISEIFQILLVLKNH